MTPTGAKTNHHRELEDALTYLPRKHVLQYRRGEVIYDQEKPSTGISLVIRGRVKVCTNLENGSQVVIGIYGNDQFFGESGLTGASAHAEKATTLEPTTLMSWSTAEIEEHIEHQPKLGLALIQMVVNRCLDFEDRLQSLALDKTPGRIALSLVRFSEKMGAHGEDGAVKIPPLTHQLISDYVGTSREIVTFQMNQLRQQGYIRYSRKSIEVYADALRERLRQNAMNGGQ